MGFLLFPRYGLLMGLRLAALRARRSSANSVISSILSCQHKYQHSRADLSMVFCKQTSRDWLLIWIFSSMNKNCQHFDCCSLGLGFRVLFHRFNFGLPWTLNYLWPLELLIKVNKSIKNIANEIYLFPWLTSQSQGDSKTCSWTK